jgi:hypothetical protein
MFRRRATPLLTGEPVCQHAAQLSSTALLLSPEPWPGALAYIIDFLKGHGQTIKDVISSAAAISTVIRNARSIGSGGDTPGSTKSALDEPPNQTAKDLHSRLTAVLIVCGFKSGVAAAKSLAILDELDKDKNGLCSADKRMLRCFTHDDCDQADSIVRRLNDMLQTPVVEKQDLSSQAQLSVGTRARYYELWFASGPIELRT